MRTFGRRLSSEENDFLIHLHFFQTTIAMLFYKAAFYNRSITK